MITIWSEKMVESSMEMAELENASPHEAEKWLISLRFTSRIKIFYLYNGDQSSHDEWLLKIRIMLVMTNDYLLLKLCNV